MYKFQIVSEMFEKNMICGTSLKVLGIPWCLFDQKLGFVFLKPKNNRSMRLFWPFSIPSRTGYSNFTYPKAPFNFQQSQVESSGNIFDPNLPKGSIKGHGRHKGTPKKPTIKTRNSSFFHDDNPPHDTENLPFLPEILQPYISKVLDVKSNGNFSLQLVSYFLGSGKYDHLAMWNEIHEDTMERGEWFNPVNS
ncbi:hypothetical protein VP01_4719g1 [Puccinia sorghi]|uniref:Uncharacterized protein n=1 Tax=Puccinia sorghi TaxID=27349 RepID=A0A0L6UMZ7_9BASI|nr:hypothetical protein VP01_4719g1 [Puccinia sorghi]